MRLLKWDQSSLFSKLEDNIMEGLIEKLWEVVKDLNGFISIFSSFQSKN